MSKVPVGPVNGLTVTLIPGKEVVKDALASLKRGSNPQLSQYSIATAGKAVAVAVAVAVVVAVVLLLHEEAS